MFRCKECGAVFESPRTICDKVPYGSTNVDLESYVCPNCGDDCYEAAKKCKNCGSGHFLDGDLCEDCREELKYKLVMKWREVVDLCKEYGLDDAEIFDEFVEEYETQKAKELLKNRGKTK